MDSLGLSGRLLVAWDPRKAKLNFSVVSARILLAGFFKDFPKELNLINVYGLYNGKELFLDNIFSEGTFDFQNLVIDGDLNST